MLTQIITAPPWTLTGTLRAITTNGLSSAEGQGISPWKAGV